MSTPLHPSAKTNRRSAKKQKPIATQNGTQSDQLISDTDSTSFQPSHVQSDFAHLRDDKAQPRRKSHASKKSAGPTDILQHERPATEGHQRERTKATPVKQAYAGPTFHQSPAASALPLPSFYSKSVPNVSSMHVPSDSKENAVEGIESVPREDPSPEKRESTPLDYLFEAARQARGTPRAESPATNLGISSVPAGSPVSRSPAPREGDSLFPFELDGANAIGDDGSAFAAPYKDRLEALQSTRSASESPKPLDERERRAIADSLKQALMVTQGQPGLSLPGPNDFDLNNPFNARQPQFRTQLDSSRPLPRHRSGPSTPGNTYNYSNFNGQPQYFPNMPGSGQQRTSPNKGASSSLRIVYGPSHDSEPAELSSDNTLSSPRISTARKRTPQPPAKPATHVPQLEQSLNQTPMTNRGPTPTAQQMEAHLRSVLKLDIVGES